VIDINGRNLIHINLAQDSVPDYIKREILGESFMRIRYVAFHLFTFILLTSIVQSQSSTRGFREQNQQDETLSNSGGKYYALLIANQEYEDKRIRQLDEPLKDAERLRDVLKSHYNFLEQNITVLKNPKRSDIYLALQTMSDMLTEQDNMLIFYAGHGIFDERQQQGYWLPADAKKNIRSDWISNSDIRDNIRGVKAKHTLIISDACFSGGIFKTRRVSDDAEISIRELDRLPSRKAITSGTLNEVPDKSVFVEYLVKRLIENKDKYLTSQRLFASFQEAVINNSPNRQTPQFGVIHEVGDEGGDFIFYRTEVSRETPKITSLTISSSVMDAEVYVDGKLIGKASPYFRFNDVKPGPRNVEVRKKGYTPYRKGIIVAENSDNKMDVVLDALKYGSLIVRTNLPATLFINDNTNGTVDGEKTFSEIIYGDYDIKLQKPGYKVYAARVTINDNRDYVVDATLKPYSASLKLNGTVFGKVYVDGEFVGNAPLEKFEIPVGKKTILVSKAGYIDYEREVDFVADKQYTIPYTLTPKTIGSAMYRSAIFPGSGQRYQDRTTMGFFYSVAFLGAVGGVVKTQLDLNERVDNFNTFADIYINETNPALIPYRKSNLTIAESSKKKAEDLRNLAAAGLAGVYLLNLLDIVLFEPSYEDDISISFLGNPSLHGPSISASIRF
jgi:hypothetical protein